VFKSSIFLRKTILGTTPDFAKFVCLNPDLFPVQYPKTVEFVSPNAVFFEDGPSHLAVKKLFTKFALPESLQTMVQSLESIIVANLESWEQQGTVVGSQATEMLIADTSSYIAFGVNGIRRTPEGALALNYLLQMINSVGAIPINLPGTAYNKGLKARTALRLYLKSVVDQRKTEKTVKNDILQLLLEAGERARGDEVKYFEEDKLIDEMVGA
jgi:(+)-abscisic acid 8'-hydroxylase